MDGSDLAMRAARGWVLIQSWGPLGAACANLVAEVVVLAVYALIGAMGAARGRFDRSESGATWPGLARRTLE